MKLIQSLNLMENQKLILWLNVVSLPLIGLFYFLFRFLAFHFTTPPISKPFSLLSLVLCFFLLIGLVVLHELIHGLFFKLFHPKGKVKFGFKNGMAYATSPNSFYTKGKFASISLAPFFLITLGLWFSYQVGALGPYAFIILASIHGSACVGDFYWVYLLLKAPKGVLVEDTEFGINFYEK